MPDGDYLRFAMSAPWRRVMRSLQRHDAPGRTEDLVVKAVAATVRARGGVRDLPQAGAALHEAGSAADPLAAYQAIKPRVPRDVLPRLLDQVALTMASNLQRSLDLVSPTSAADILARRLLERVARHSGFERMIPDLVGEGVYTASAINQIIGEIFSGSQMEKLARSLVRHPTGERLRAPRRVSKSLSFSEVMSADLEEL